MKTLIDQATVLALISDCEDCICCDGGHRYSTTLTDSAGDRITTLYTVYDAIKNLPSGTKVRVLLEIIE